MDLGYKRRGLYLEEDVDHISRLPDEILILILCQLSLKEAASTSILSKRWKFLWTYVKALNFINSPEGCVVESCRYVKWVNGVLNSHRGSTIDELRVEFEVDCKYSSDIDSWIDFAIRKRSKVLAIDFSPWTGGSCHSSLLYTFPEKSFLQMIKTPSSGPFMKSLTYLSLNYVPVTERLIEHFLSTCPLLEQLHVADSEILLNLKVSGPSLRLKMLEVAYCSKLDTIEIFAPNLLSFIYLGLCQRIRILIEHAPSLVEVSVGDYRLSVGANALRSISNCFSQLETLTLRMDLQKEVAALPQFPELTRLKNLILRVFAVDNDSLLAWTFLIKGSPNLRRFTLQLLFLGGSKRNICEAAKSPHQVHQCLEVVELVGFVGRAVDTEIAMYLFENAIALKKVIIDPQLVSLKGVIEQSFSSKRKQDARKRALHLKTKLPPGAELIIR